MMAEIGMRNGNDQRCMMSDKPNFHLQFNGMHYYGFEDLNKWRNSTPLYHVDLLEPLAIGHQDGWYISDKELAPDGFFTIQGEREPMGYTLHNNLPDYINREVLASTLPHDTEDVDDELYREHNRYWYWGKPITGKWYHGDGKPRIDVVFSWRAEFPGTVANYPELYHLLPCRVVFGERSSKNKTLEWIKEQIQTRYGKDIVNLYVFDDYYSIEFRNVPNIRNGYPLMQAANLEALNTRFHAWFDGLCQKIERQIHYSKTGFIPETFVPPFDKTEFESEFNRVMSIAVGNAYKDNKSEVHTEMMALRRYVWQMLLSAAAFESGLIPPKDLADIP